MANKKIILLLIIIAVAAATAYVAYISFFKSKTVVTQEEIYTCPMHPQIVRDHPGTCPICGMDLVLKTPSTVREQHEIEKLDLTEVQLSPSQQVLANVRTEQVRTMTFEGEKTFNGYVKIDERNLKHISTPVAGKILKQYVNFEGQYVKAGQPVFEIYSQELYSAQKEYLLALDNYDRINQAGSRLASEQAASMVEAARTKLSLWELKPSQIETLERTGEVKYSITEYAKVSGVVTKKYSHAGHWAMAGEDIYDIADISNVWIIANIYQSDMQYIKAGQIADITSDAYPGEVFRAKVNFLEPVFSADSRTLEVRIDAANPGNKLKPGMYVKVKIISYITQSLAVPKNSVIKTGERNIVYIEKEPGVYSPREIGVGYEQDGYIAVTFGLKEGERVVSSGGFLIDSETQIREAMTSGHEH